MIQRLLSYVLMVLLTMASGVLLYAAPDMLSMVIISIMMLILVVSCLAGLIPLHRYIAAFQKARERIEEAAEAQTQSVWFALLQRESFFGYTKFDAIFEEYKDRVQAQRQENAIVSDIDAYINENVLSRMSWHNVIQQVPGTLTGIGLLGTFTGLLIGIRGIGFSSVDAAVSSIQSLLTGIQLAFYTSVAGVILSILFNLFLEYSWNFMSREMEIFMDSFHKNVLPSMNEQMIQSRHESMGKILAQLEILTQGAGYSVGRDEAAATERKDEEIILMPQIMEGLNNREFIFHLQPRFDLNTRKIIGGESLIRWNHGEMGMVSPENFIPLLERNGYITKLDCYIWEQVCATIRKWIDDGIRPVALSVNVTKTDIMAGNVAEIFSELIEKYKIPPKYLEVEIAQNAYLMVHGITELVEKELQQMGVRVVVDGFDGDFFSFESVVGQSKADAVKLDLRRISKTKGNEVIPPIIAHAQQKHMTLSVSGIETMEQLSILRKCGCNEGQGFYLSKAIAADEFAELISK